MLESFRADIDRLREIDRELDDMENPWPEAAQGVLHDPERLEEAEALLASVRERTRPFPPLAPGPDLAGLEGKVPQLALKASQQLVTVEKPQYNPLFLWAEDTMAPRALLAAAARTFRSERPEDQTAVIAVSEFAEDFIRALSAGVAGAWRERWWTVDLLLVHGAEALTDTERAQDEFFHLFEALKRRGARVMIVADRPPSRIGGIDERLRSRFEGGLVLEVAGTQVSAGEADLTLHVPGEEVPSLPEVVDEGPEIPPLDQIDKGEGRGGLFVEREAPAPAGGDAQGPEAAEAAEATAVAVEPAPSVGAAEGSHRWVPTREKVVWFWPQMQDRLVEDLE